MLRKGLENLRLEGKPDRLPRTPLQRYGTPEEVANVIIFLLSKESSFVTASVYSVDGGWCA
jgi:NAD(P)-dependent dehydrogenase (short-subunit alcohol dehydrogenase family)